MSEYTKVFELHFNGISEMVEIENNVIYIVLTCAQWILDTTCDLKSFSCNPHGFAIRDYNGFFEVTRGVQNPLGTREDYINTTLDKK